MGRVTSWEEEEVAVSGVWRIEGRFEGGKMKKANERREEEIMPYQGQRRGKKFRE